jgi:CheY-like chemotaxis protein
VAKHLVELHGGTIGAESEGKNKGAAFTVSLPCAPAKEPGEEVPIDVELLKGKTVLFVDDDRDMCTFVTRLLTAAGAQVHAAGSAEEGLELLKTINADVVISDISMPGLDGYAFIRQLRSSKGWCRHVPCIALTALARQVDREKALEAGYDEHLAKPFDPVLLAGMAARLAARARGAQDPNAASAQTGAPTHILLAEGLSGCGRVDPLEPGVTRLPCQHGGGCCRCSEDRGTLAGRSPVDRSSAERWDGMGSPGPDSGDSAGSRHCDERIFGPSVCRPKYRRRILGIPGQAGE